MLTKFLAYLAPHEKEGHDSVTELITQAILSIQSRSHEDFLELFNEQLAAMITLLSKCFQSFIQSQATVDNTWQFWTQFVFEDCMAYIGLFLAIRSGDWNLRMACIKQLATIFTAFDHSTYQWLIATHISDVLSMPQPLLTML